MRWSICLLLAACGAPEPIDVTMDASATVDAAVDAGPNDSGEIQLDAGELDAGDIDAGETEPAPIQPIIDETCSPCHLGGRRAGQLSLDDVNALIGAPSHQHPDVMLIVPGDQANSYVMQKLRGTIDDGTNPMPPPISPSRHPTADEIEQIGAFIDGL